MDTIELVARNGDAVRQAIELGDIVHMGTASEELTDEFLLFAINSGLLSTDAKLNLYLSLFPTDPHGKVSIGNACIVLGARTYKNNCAQVLKDVGCRLSRSPSRSRHQHGGAVGGLVIGPLCWPLFVTQTGLRVAIGPSFGRLGLQRRRDPRRSRDVAARYE